MPVAEEYKVRMGCHPQDPGVPKGTGWRGVDAVLGSPDGLKRFVSIKESPYHGLNFCQGTVSEQLEKPGEQIFDVIRYFGSRKKIFSVHFRNIEGGFLNFRETFIDNGSVDMLKAMRVYKEVGYDGMMMPDHVPRDRGRRQRPGLRVRVRLHQGADRRRVGRELTGVWHPTKGCPISCAPGASSPGARRRPCRRPTLATPRGSRRPR